jgi:hypothetical protein
MQIIVCKSTKFSLIRGPIDVSIVKIDFLRAKSELPVKKTGSS